MANRASLYLSSLLLYCCFLTTCKSTKPPNAATDVFAIERIDQFSFDASIRAIAATNTNTVWWAGSKGMIGHTKDGGKNWYLDSIKYQDQLLHFRAIAVTREAVFVLSIASPALLYKSVDEGQSWQLVYQENHPGAFYDAMQFWNEREGIAMGDPTDACLSIIITRDGGESWQKIPCDRLPPAAAGEAAFAASNSNIALYNDQVWIVSGGAKARVLHSPDKGVSWSVYQSPIVEGGQMTGIYAVDFWNEQKGIIIGGDWNDQARNTQNKAMTTDGGKNWRLLADGKEPGYRSSVRFVPTENGQAILAVGIPGISLSTNGGEAWQTLRAESWYTLSFVPQTREAWLAGDGKIGKIIWQ